MGFFKNQLNKQLDNFKQSIPDERLDELEALRRRKYEMAMRIVPIFLSLNRI